ncbi:hypothetical protein K9L63_01460 [Candidatus Gracilibacteria bacterium]|nr:hypothetical protein [Candidatus Gracilibacteria bacterium]
METNNQLLPKLEVLENGIDVGEDVYVRTRIQDENDFLKLVGEIRRLGKGGAMSVIEHPEVFAQGIGIVRKNEEGESVIWIRREVVKTITELLQAA